MKRLLLTCILLAAAATAFAQQKNLWLNRQRTFEVERQLVHNDSTPVHSALRPLLESRVGAASDGEYLVPDRKYYYLFGSKMLREHLGSINEVGFQLTLDPLFDLGVNYDWNDTLQLNILESGRVGFNLPATNTRGALLQGDIGMKVSFQSMLYETQMAYPQWLFNQADSLGVVPGQGRFKLVEGRKLDYNQSYGWVSWKAAEWLQLQAGHGKHFIGHGYRSMLLSDAAFNYPYIRSTAYALNDKLQYTWMYAGLQTLERLPRGDVPESLFRRKALSMAYLSYIPIPELEVGLFESVTWQRWDSAQGTQPIAPESLLPVLGTGILGKGFDDMAHVVAGVNLRYTLPFGGWLYGQFVTDGPADGRYGYQVGAKFFDVLVQRLHLQAEYNFASEGLYTHPAWHQEYSHFNQPLAHPSGTHFDEFILGLYYQYKRWFLDVRQHYLDRDLTASGNIFPGASDQGFTTSPFISRSTTTSVQLGVMLNPVTNMQLTLGYQYRDQTIGPQVEVANWTWIRWKTALWNHYTDF